MYQSLILQIKKSLFLRVIIAFILFFWLPFKISHYSINIVNDVFICESNGLLPECEVYEGNLILYPLILVIGIYFFIPFPLIIPSALFFLFVRYFKE